jgi:HEAT repeat protein
LLLVVVGTVAGIWQRERLWIWYCAERLERASDDDRGLWADELTACGEPAVPTMLRLLRHDDPGVCAASKSAIGNVASNWPRDDERLLAFAKLFVDEEPRFSTHGRAVALDLLHLVLATNDPEITSRVKEIVAATAKSESVDVRIQAIAAAMRPEVNCLEAIVGLVNDPAAEVRRAAVLAIGPVRDGSKPVLADDSLLRCLHDEDEEVRRLAEMSLKSRGRTPRDIRLGRRYAAPDPAERQKLLIDLAYEEELDVSVWLERLTNDSDPSVRAGAARVAADRRVDLADRLGQMSKTDPDATVRRIAEYYRLRILASR